VRLSWLISVPADYQALIENLRERIETSEEISDDDRAALLEFDDRLLLLSRQYSDARHKTLLGKATRMAERCGGLADSLYDEAAAEHIVRWIHGEYSNEESNRDHRAVLRVFGKRVAESRDDVETDSDGLPVSLAWVPSGTSSNYDPTPDPRDMLRWEADVVPMIEAAYNDRDAAMIALQFDGGFRGGEFKQLKIGDFQDHQHGLQATVDGKQNRRTVTLITSVPWINDWLGDHPADRSDADAPLWSKLNTVERVSDKMIYKAFGEVAERAGVTKPVTLTNFRKSSAAFLASRNVNQAHLEDHHGWVRGSRAASRYISVFAGDTEREIARAHGVEIPEADEPDPTAPIPCPRCGANVPRHEPVCNNCGQAMTTQAAQELAALDDETMQSISQEPDELNTIQEFRRRSRDDVEFRKRTIDHDDAS